RLDCIRAYNDFLTDFASVDPDRFVLLTAVPLWDVKAAAAEIERCADRGHHGVLFIGKPTKIDLPRLSDDHWEPIFKTVESIGSSINFHTGFADFDEADFRRVMKRDLDRSDYAKNSSTILLNNAEAIADVIMSGVADRYPGVNFVSVESGFGWVPSFVETMDWQWLNSGAQKAHPDREMPSTYFRRQFHGMFWFEGESVKRVLDLYPDNVMFETDFPHPTSLSPGPASSAKNPKEVVQDMFHDLPASLARKVLSENAARVYGLKLPAEQPA
ncbi:MAG: amidohydrolase, partial [Ilumatobacteraceae bacterium]|nr:amidohydrolase [Ilumatobacteraceae bacterium]